MRCDRVDFPADGVAFLHTHQGPGIRCLVDGLFAVETQGTRHEIDRLGAWFEAGPDPVYAEVRGDQPAAFVRVMILPQRLLGSPSIRYVRDEDRDRPKSPALHRLRRRAAGVSRSGGQLLADQLVVHGVDLAFGVPGESYIGLLDAPRRRTATASASSPRGTRAARPTWRRPTAS